MRLALTLVLLVAASPLLAQGRTGSGVALHVVRADHSDSGLVADVEVTDLRTGQRIDHQTGANGRLRLENLSPGGPWRITARALGYQPLVVDGIRLQLGEMVQLRLPLPLASVALPPITVVARADSLRLSSSGGPSSIVTQRDIQHFPLLNRDMVDLIQTTPEANGTSVAGANNRYNNILIDGGSDNDYFGLSRGTGTPGGQIGTRSIPLDAVQEFQVDASPYDARLGDFTGGRINAVTHSGTNRYQGTAFVLYQGEALTGHDSAGTSATDFSNWQFGASVGGPIVKDKILFFAAGEMRERQAPYVGPLIGSPTDVGISVDSANRFVSILQGYGLDPGSYGGYTTSNRSGNVFAKLTALLGPSGVLEASLNYANGSIQDTLAPPRTVGADYRLTSAGFEPASTQWSGRLRWTAALSDHITNEFLVTVLHVDEPRTPVTGYPAIFVGNVGNPGFGGARLIAGADPSSQQLGLTQGGFGFSNTSTFALGPHQLSAGLDGDFLNFNFSSFPSAIGQYQFASLAAFEAGTSSRFIRSVELRPGGSTAAFGANRLGVFVQDHWQVNDRLAVLAGLRMDITMLDPTPTANSALLTSPLAVNTSSFIRALPLWGPRVGFNWAVARSTDVRGGVGLFSGRVPYSWVSFAYTQTGNDAVLLNCSGAAAPAFNPDPATQPTACLTASSPPIPTVTTFSPDFKMPQSLKLSLGLDQRLPWGMVASLDGMYERGQQMYINDLNLNGPAGELAGEGGRVQYGTIAASSASGALPAVTPSRVTTAFGPVFQNSSRTSDQTWWVTAQVGKRFGGPIEMNAAYTYMSARDLMSLRDAQTVSNYGFVAVDGNLANRRLATSVFSTPSKVTVTATANLPARFAFSLIYIGRSGLPFTYVVNGDANADGVGNRAGAFDRQQNDAVYVPVDLADASIVRDSITTGTATVLVPDPAAAARLNEYIDAQGCLQRARGTIMERNGCRNPWQNILNARVGWQLVIHGRQTMDFTLDVFNLLNLLSSSWGLIRETGNFASAGGENVPLLKLRGQDAANGRNQYEVTLPPTNVINIEASRWRLQLGARYAF